MLKSLQSKKVSDGKPGPHKQLHYRALNFLGLLGIKNRADNVFVSKKTDDSDKISYSVSDRSLPHIKSNSRFTGIYQDEVLSHTTVLDTVTSTLDEKKISFNQMVEEVAGELEIPSETLEVNQLSPIACDKSEMKQVWSNLLFYTHKYGNRRNYKPRIKISCYHQKNGIVYFLKDNSTSYHNSRKSKLFHLFHHLDRFNDAEETVAGLAQAKEIIENHGGNIWVESSWNNGNTLFFRLPK